MAKLPGISHRRAVKAFKKAGFWVVREGKHISMTDGERIIIIPLISKRYRDENNTFLSPCP
jgi:predicted RNA binding protein YcfA (HicA-like mRNA interferase family)